jgi:hypothetical protein
MPDASTLPGRLFYGVPAHNAPDVAGPIHPPRKIHLGGQSIRQLGATGHQRLDILVRFNTLHLPFLMLPAIFGSGWPGALAAAHK